MKRGSSKSRKTLRLQSLWVRALIAMLITVLPLSGGPEWGSQVGPRTVAVGVRQFEVTMYYEGLGDPPFFERTWAEVSPGMGQVQPTQEQRKAAIGLVMSDIAANPVFWGRLGPEARIIHWSRVGRQIVPSLAVALVVLIVWAAWDRFRMSPRRRPGHCSVCGYDLAGLAGPCPECGAAR